MTNQQQLDQLRQEYEDLMRQGRVEWAHRILERRDYLLMDTARVATMNALGFDRFGRPR